MKAFAQALDLKDDPALIEQYKAYHRAVWPEVTAALRAIGISKMRIFRLGTHLYMYYEAPDDFNPGRDFQSYASQERTSAWDELMRTFQKRVPEAGQEDWWTPMEMVFDLDWA